MTTEPQKSGHRFSVAPMMDWTENSMKSMRCKRIYALPVQW